jgi:hypothetical protein
MSWNNSTYPQSPATIFDAELSEDDSDVSDMKDHGSDEEMDDNKSKKEPTFDEKKKKVKKVIFPPFRLGYKRFCRNSFFFFYSGVVVPRFDLGTT